ncbi:acyloxyacyl hydrolase [Ferruginivarius sediminum]|uniref:acyloxyacyl hydrolase n=1 Tax=Ferruginivarius sediminum TaxID=2661937 RepID=UPI00137B619A|nr:acyloxyacyl hydrolase [Ferruginivarius sediminum]
MRERAVLLILAMLIAGLWAGRSVAQEADGSMKENADPAYLSVGAGWYDLVDGEDEAADFRLEYRHDEGIWLVKPWAGLELTGDGGLWAGGGALIDVDLGKHIVLTGATGVGAYEEGSGKDLGSTLEFRSQAEVAWRFDDRSRLALAFSHISNAGIGDDNPGTEIVTLYYHLPIGRLSQALGQ